MALALFDFDGTITTHETMPDFLSRSISRRRLLIGWILLAPIVAGYKIGLVSGGFTRSVLVRFAYTGMPVSALTIRGEDFAKDRLPHVLRPEAMERIAWHRAQGHKVVVVSGGLDVYLRPWCEAQGLDLLCSTLEVCDGRLTGRYDGEQCVLAEKATQIVVVGSHHRHYMLCNFRWPTSKLNRLRRAAESSKTRMPIWRSWKRRG